MIDPRRLGVLQAVATHRSVAGAADALHLSPPAVSQQLLALERETEMSASSSPPSWPWSPPDAARRSSRGRHSGRLRCQPPPLSSMPSPIRRKRSSKRPERCTL
ncbi:MAG: helix-turn-helix domain-containing protein [Trebonia sp.]